MEGWALFLLLLRGLRSYNRLFESPDRDLLFGFYD
jgi:hypothetical protein